MTEIVKKEEYGLVSEDDMDFLIKFDEYKKRAKVIEDSIKAKANDFLEANEVESYTQSKDGITLRIYKTKPYRKKQIDTKALKDQGLYEEFAKDVWVKGATRIQVEYPDE